MKFQVETETLSDEAFMRLSERFAEKDAQHWDAQIVNDAAGGKLGFLLEEATLAKAQREPSTPAI